MPRQSVPSTVVSAKVIFALMENVSVPPLSSGDASFSIRALPLRLNISEDSISSPAANGGITVYSRLSVPLF